MSVILVIALGTILPGISRASDIPILRHNPPPGSLHRGERVLVDDGSCPKGEIKELTGGNNLGAGRRAASDRIKQCVPRP
jgi:hypothetical protein